jgi:hypothetical protein
MKNLRFIMEHSEPKYMEWMDAWNKLETLQDFLLKIICKDVLSLLKTWYCNSDCHCSYVPATGINPQNIRGRNERKHIRHGAPQIVPMYVQISEHS